MRLVRSEGLVVALVFAAGCGMQDAGSDPGRRAFAGLESEEAGGYIEAGRTGEPESAAAADAASRTRVSLDPTTGRLTVTGNKKDNTIVIGGDAAGTLRINGMQVKFRGRDLLVAEVTSLHVSGLGGDDLLALDETAGAMPAATLVGGPGDDTMVAGSGEDTFVWNAGDGSDVVDGEAGFDALAVEGSREGDLADLAANGQRLLVALGAGGVDAGGVERVALTALAGADEVTVGDLDGTDVIEVVADLGDGDGAVDGVTVNGTGVDDVVVVFEEDGAVRVVGLPASVAIRSAEGTDRLRVNGLGGDDALVADALPAVLLLTLDGGADDDVLIGSDGDDVLLGGDGHDVILGGPGLDVLDGGAGDNVVVQD